MGRSVPVPSSSHAWLRRWFQPHVLEASIPFRPPPPSVEVFTDALLQSWGVSHSFSRCLPRVWSGALWSCHISFLGLVAIYIAILSLSFDGNTPVAVCICPPVILPVCGPWRMVFLDTLLSCWSGLSPRPPSVLHVSRSLFPR